MGLIRVQLDPVVRLLHHVQVQLQRSLGVQAEGIILTVQMGTLSEGQVLLGSSGVGIGEQAT